MAEASAPGKSKSGKKRTRELIVRDGSVGILKEGGLFQPYTNFCVEVFHAVKSPAGAPTLFGYVYTVRTTGGQVE